MRPHWQEDLSPELFVLNQNVLKPQKDSYRVTAGQRKTRIARDAGQYLGWGRGFSFIPLQFPFL